MKFPRFRWFVLVTLCLVSASTIIVLVGPVTLVGSIANSLGLSLGQTTAVMMGGIDLFVGISAFMGGFFLDRFGVNRVWFVCLLMTAGGGILSLFLGTSYAGMLFVRALQGCGAGPIIASYPLVTAQWFPVKERGVVIGIQGAMVSVGAAVSLWLVPHIFHLTGNWKMGMVGAGSAPALGLVLVLIVALGPKPPVLKLKHDERPQVKLRELKGAFSQPATWSVMFVAFFFAWDTRVFNDLVPNYLAMNPPIGAGMGPVRAGGFMSGMQIAFMVGSIASGIITEKLFRGRPKPLVALGFLVFAATCFALQSSSLLANPLLLAICLWVGGFALSVTSPQALTFIAKCYPERIIGKLGGLIAVFSIVGGLAGLAAASVALHVTDRYKVSINLVSIGALIGFAAALGLSHGGEHWRNMLERQTVPLGEGPPRSSINLRSEA